MSTLKALVIAAVVLAGGAHVWQSHQRAAAARELQALADSNGFVPVQMPDGTPRDTVLILAPLNCPSAAAKRAEALAARLSKMGIPNVRRNNYSISNPTPDELAGIKRAYALSGGEIPVVMINGRAKDNPTADEIATEYRND
ncbi:MAG: hypothetical protein WAU56_08090 [Steroidobacteraceae bacterium]